MKKKNLFKFVWYFKKILISVGILEIHLVNLENENMAIYVTFGWIFYTYEGLSTHFEDQMKHCRCFKVVEGGTSQLKRRGVCHVLKNRIYRSRFCFSPLANDNLPDKLPIADNLLITY